MAALAGDRNTKSKSIDKSVAYPTAAAVKIFGGSLVAIIAGFARPAADTAGGRVIGVADWQVDNLTGAAGAKTVRVRRGVFKFNNGAAGEALVQADVGKVVFAVDDQTVGKVGGTNTVVAGELLEIDPDGQVWVQVPTERAAV
jgi:hypothetical protein